MSTTDALRELANLHNTLLVNSGLMQTGTTDLQSPNTVQVEERPWNKPPEGYIPFDLQGSIQLPVVGAGVSAILTMVVPDGMDGVINRFNCNFTGGGFNDFSGDIVWSIYMDTIAIRGFDNIVNQKGTFQQPREITPIRIYSNRTIYLYVNHVNNPGLAGNAVGGFIGYFYPSRG